MIFAAELFERRLHVGKVVGDWIIVSPVESDAEHAVVPQGGDEEVDVLAGGAEVGEGAVVERDLPDAAAVAVAERLGRGVAAAQPGPLRQDQLQLGRRPARDQRADQRQRVLVEVRLKRNADENRSVCTYPCCLVRE